MFCFKDRSYCCSPNCNNECGRKMSDEDKELLNKLSKKWAKDYPECDLGYPVAYGFFCGEPGESNHGNTKTNG